MSTTIWIFLSKIPIKFCIPFVDPSQSVTLIKIITWLVVLPQFVSVMTIAMVHILLLQELKKHQNTLKDKMSKIQTNSFHAVQLLIMSTSNIICWVPSGAIFIITMFIDRYPMEMILWTIVAVGPINAIVNPCINTFTTGRKKSKNV